MGLEAGRNQWHPFREQAKPVPRLPCSQERRRAFLSHIRVAVCPFPKTRGWAGRILTTRYRHLCLPAAERTKGKHCLSFAIGGQGTSSYSRCCFCLWTLVLLSPLCCSASCAHRSRLSVLSTRVESCLRIEHCLLFFFRALNSL